MSESRHFPLLLNNYREFDLKAGEDALESMGCLHIFTAISPSPCKPRGVTKGDSADFPPEM